MPLGRPTKYNDDRPDELFAALAAGNSVTQFAASIGVTRASIYEWAKRHDAFSDALTRGQEASEAYWEGELQKMMYNNKANAPLVKLYFANRFGWRDNKHEPDANEELAKAIEIIRAVKASE